MRRFLYPALFGATWCFWNATAWASPLLSFGSDPESVARAMAVTASVTPAAAAAVNPARLIDAQGIEISAGVVIADTALKIQNADANLDAYVAYELGAALALPVGKWRDRLYLGFDVHLPHNGLYAVDNPSQEETVSLRTGNDARRFSFDGALGVRIWNRVAVGLGFHIMPDVAADVAIDFGEKTQNSQSHVEVGYKFAPTAGIYAQIGDMFRAGFAYRAATRLSLDVPARVHVSDSIGRIYTRLKGYAYSEPHDFSIGIMADFSKFAPHPAARFNLHAAAQIHCYPYPIATSAAVTLYDNDGNAISETAQDFAKAELAYALRVAIDWRPLDEIAVSVGYAFEKTHVPAQRTVFNVLDADRNQIAFGASFWLPEAWLQPLNIGLATSAKIDFYDTRDVEKYDFLVGNPGFPAIRFEGLAFAYHVALRFRFR